MLEAGLNVAGGAARMLPSTVAWSITREVSEQGVYLPHDWKLRMPPLLYTHRPTLLIQQRSRRMVHKPKWPI
ncbi:hypothetical protein COMA2_20190 [Candidatus Nitrospira nitrificans]|uniref:Uncharacterized protein n=1 Tax=Candidatus Nitrospira nitrificans TaxID=1742973 RepID=A0A0S4LF05_9BACT|nr:hypothetical protein COMA2_20190 [Candidatus Nitrospira nitrificans]